MATVGKNVSAAIFWMKARAGWREKHEVHIDVEADQISHLSDEELEREIPKLVEEIKVGNERTSLLEQRRHAVKQG